VKRRNRKHPSLVPKRELFKEKARLQGRLQEVEAEKRALEEKLREVQKENRALERENDKLREQNTRLRSENLKLTERLARTGAWDSGPGQGAPTGSKSGEPRKRRRRRRGRPPGHAGCTRPKPDVIDEEIRVRPAKCPMCLDPLPTPTQWDEHTQEDVVLGHRVRRYEKGRCWCKRCNSWVVAVHPDELPNSPFGVETTALALYLRHEMNLPLEKIQALFGRAGVSISTGGLSGLLSRAAGYLETDYELLREEAQGSPWLHIDETGARVDGRRAFLWAFTNDRLTYFEHNASRGRSVPEGVLGEDWEGIVICDFYAAYNKIGVARQRCIRHLIQDLSKLSAEKGDKREVRRFTKKVFRLVRDAARLKERRGGLSVGAYERRRRRLQRRLEAIGAARYRDPDCSRLGERLYRHREEIFLFLDNASIDWTNNRAEREIRPSVVLRKIIGGHRTERGARCHAVVRSVIQTAKRRTQDILQTLKEAIRGGFVKIKEKTIRANEDVVIEMVKSPTK
jgi:regulator of replication initiation timing